VVLIILFPMVMTSIHDLQVEEQTDATLPCTSSPDDVTLTEDLWQDDLGSVLSGVDNEGNVLTATGYVPATNVLTVTGWVTPATTCAIVYETDGLTAFTGMGALVGITPLLVWMAFLFIMVFSLWTGVKSREGF
jgi:hypothetical protein